MGVALSLDKMSRKEKIQAMESLWDDLCRHAEKVRSPEWHAAVLEQREESLRVGEAEFSDWDAAKKRIGKSAGEDQAS
jgi:putative addiction module component (TIGR02574 family)